MSGVSDELLCHDDELEGRRIAFILYLVDPDWTAEDGGLPITSPSAPLSHFVSVQGRWGSSIQTVSAFECRTF